MDEKFSDFATYVFFRELEKRNKKCIDFGHLKPNNKTGFCDYCYMPTTEKLLENLSFENEGDSINQDEFFGTNKYDSMNRIMKLRKGFYHLRALQKIYKEEWGSK